MEEAQEPEASSLRITQSPHSEATGLCRHQKGDRTWNLFCPTSAPPPKTLASIWLLGTSHRIPRRPPLHPIHRHKAFHKTQFII